MQKIIKFLREVQVEFKNITWPKKEALIQLTVVVISISVIISLILGGFDYLFTNSIAYIGEAIQTSQPKVENTNTTDPFVLITPTASPSATVTNTPIKK